MIPTNRRRTTASSSSCTGKRKLEDYSPEAHGGDLCAVHDPDPAPPVWVQFFVRMIPESKTMVIQANSSDKVVSIHERIHERTGIPVSEQRLVYLGKQLQWDQTLADCSIGKEANLQLVGRIMRSTENPKAWQIIDDMVSIVCRLCKGEELVEEYAAVKIIKSQLNDYFSMTTKFGNDYNVPGGLHIFLSSSAPQALVMLYLCNKECGEECIKHLLKLSQIPFPIILRPLCAPIVLELCNLLRRISPKDQLYLLCRSVLGSLLETVGVLRTSKDLDLDHHVERMIEGDEIFPFVIELADTLSSDLVKNAGSPVTLAPLPTDVHDFSVFLSHVLAANITELSGYRVEYLYHHIFEGMLTKMDECLAKMEEWMADELSCDSQVFHQRWSQYVAILKELKAISAHYAGSEDRLLDILRLRKHAICRMILRYAKKPTDCHYWLLNHKDVVNFECRRHLLMLLFPEIREEGYHHEEVLIDRSLLLSNSFEYVIQKDPISLHSVLFMKFKDEDATGPGVVREWFFLVFQALFNQERALFVACPEDRTRFYPNPASKFEKFLNLDWYKFSGRMIALALMYKVQVGVALDRVFFLQLAGKDVSLEDIQDADPVIYRSFKNILEMDPESIDSDDDVLGLTFVREVEVRGGFRNMVELCPGGRYIAVNSKNREEYVKLLVKHRFVTSISEQVSKFDQGFTDIISTRQHRKIFFQIIAIEDLDLMLRGSGNNIYVEDWKSHTEYNGYLETDPQIFWFWKVVAEMTAPQRQELLFFWTSVRHLPMEGFRGLASSLQIYKSNQPTSHLPTSNTCFFRLSVPPYTSLSITRERLHVIAKDYVGSSFGML